MPKDYPLTAVRTSAEGVAEAKYTSSSSSTQRLNEVQL